jgi:hypothetical protein
MRNCAAGNTRSNLGPPEIRITPELPDLNLGSVDRQRSALSSQPSRMPDNMHTHTSAFVTKGMRTTLYAMHARDFAHGMRRHKSCTQAHARFCAHTHTYTYTLYYTTTCWMCDEGIIVMELAAALPMTARLWHDSMPRVGHMRTTGACDARNPMSQTPVSFAWGERHPM